MKKIASFTVDHDKVGKGMFISRIDGDVITYDVRMKIPNGGDYLPYAACHTIEHLFATYARNSGVADEVIYVGPMGCRTGFYLLMRDTSNEEAYSLVKDILKKTVDHDGEMFGAERKECGNYKELSLESAKAECARYLKALLEREEIGKADFKYDEEL